MCKPKNRIYCPECGKKKILFETETKAKNFIKFNKNEIENGDDLRPYWCVACCGYHISHKKHKKYYDNITSRVIKAYNKQTAAHTKYDYELIEQLYNRIKKKGYQTRQEVNIYLKNFDYHPFIKESAKLKYYKEINI